MLNLQYLPDSADPIFPLYDPPFNDLDEEVEEEFDDGDYEDDIELEDDDE